LILCVLQINNLSENNGITEKIRNIGTSIHDNVTGKLFINEPSNQLWAKKSAPEYYRRTFSKPNQL